MVGLQTGAATVESRMEKLKVKLPYDPAITLLAIYQKKIQNTNLKRYTHPQVHCSISYSSQDTKKPKCLSVDEQVKEM